MKFVVAKNDRFLNLFRLLSISGGSKIMNLNANIQLNKHILMENFST